MGLLSHCFLLCVLFAVVVRVHCIACRFIPCLSCLKVWVSVTELSVRHAMCVVVDFATKCNYICDCCFCIVHRTRKKKKELNVPDFLNTLQGFQQFDLIEPMHRTMLLVLLLVPSKNLLLISILIPTILLRKMLYSS